MSNNSQAYGRLCSLFYDATKTYASDQEVAFYAHYMDRNHGRVLEAMSGSGRLLIPLLVRGYTVDGVDNSPTMLARCTARSQELGLTPELFEQSLEALDIPHKYTTVTIAVGSFQLITHRDQAVRALKNLNALMITGAHLLIDTFIPEMGEGTSDRAVRLDDQTVLTLTTQYTYHAAEKRADAWCTYQLFVDGTLLQTEEELIQVTWYTDQEFEKLLNQAGFTLIAIHQETFPVTGPSRIVHAIKQ